MHPLAQLYQSLTVVAPQLVDIEAQVLARRLPQMHRLAMMMRKHNSIFVSTLCRCLSMPGYYSRIGVMKQFDGA